MSDVYMSVVLPTEFADDFIELFMPHNTNGFNIQESEELDGYVNANGVSLRTINFQPYFQLYDLVYRGNQKDCLLKTACENYNVKRLIIYRDDPISECEESITYDRKKGIVHQLRDYFPKPEEYLSDEETIYGEVEAE